MQVDPDQARQRRPEIFRLRPDKRFLIALAELDRMATSGNTTSLRLAWNGNSWRIEFPGGSRLMAPTVANYSELRHALSERAHALLRPGGSRNAAWHPERAAALKAAADRLSGAETIVALKQIDSSSPVGLGLPDGPQASGAAHAYVALTLEGLDELEMADLVQGRLLAFLALAEAQDVRPDPSDDALAAFSMGYASDALRIATSLEPNDPARLYVERRTDDLVRAARSPGSPRRVRYLALLSLASRGNATPWSELAQYAFADESESLAVLRAAAALRSFEINASLGPAVMYSTLEAMQGPTPASAGRPAEEPPRDLTDAVFRQIAEAIRERIHASPAQLARRFEGDLARTCPATRSGLWDADTCRSWYRGFFYSGLYAAGRRYLDELGSVPATREFATYLQGSPPGPGEQFARWYSDMSSVASGQPLGDAQFEDLVNVTWFGSPVLSRTYESLDNYFPHRDPAPEIGARLAQRLDARPSHLDFMTQIAARPLFDAVAREQLCVAWLGLGATAEQSQALRCRAFLSTTAELQALVQRRDLDLQGRTDALNVYCYLTGSSEKFCDAQFRELGRESGYERYVTRNWMMNAERRGDYVSLQAAADGWLAHHSPEDGLMWSVYQGRRAQALSKLGKPQEAWKVIEPELQSGQGAVMSWGSEILWQLGRTDEAIALATQTIQRYPSDAETRSLQAEMFWRMDRDADAAAVVDPAEPGYKADTGVWRDDLSKRFADVFAKKPDDRVAAAFDALVAHKIDGDRLVYLMPRLAESGRPDLAFRLSTSKLTVKRHPWTLAAWAADSYGYLEKSQGQAKASEWIQGAIPPAWREQALESFVRDKHFALLWTAVPPNEEAGLSEWSWLLRAAASLLDESAAREHRETLLGHYASSTDPSKAMGRYLLGIGDRESMTRSLKTPKDRCRAGYVLGLREIAARRFTEASEWLQLPFDACAAIEWKSNGLARSPLAEWYSTGQNLREAEARNLW
jgi:hypothetical protein